MLKLEDVASFVAVAEVGSISAAARRGGWSKSVVSSRLAALEEDLGARLFHRTTRRLSLTEDGAALAGLGIAMLPSFIVGQDSRAGTLKVLDIGLQAAPESL